VNPLGAAINNFFHVIFPGGSHHISRTLYVHVEVMFRGDIQFPECSRDMKNKFNPLSAFIHHIHICDAAGY
jgi:hypothetical protein